MKKSQAAKEIQTSERLKTSRHVMRERESEIPVTWSVLRSNQWVQLLFLDLSAPYDKLSMGSSWICHHPTHSECW